MTPIIRNAQPFPALPITAEMSNAHLGTAQIILVYAKGSQSDVYCFEKNENGEWLTCESIGAISGHVGRNGVRSDKREGDGCTPAGFFRLGYVFGCRDKPVTDMPYRAVTPDSFWIDDPESRFYNTWVEARESGSGAVPKVAYGNSAGTAGTYGWTSAERLLDEPDYYAYAAVIEYNMRPVIPGKGSAVFLHCGRTPTAGCVAVPERAMLRILKWLNPSKLPGILISENIGQHL